MTTTDRFQTNPDFYPDEKSCIQSKRNKNNSNPKYRYFKQTHLTAGDFDQFQEFRDMD